MTCTEGQGNGGMKKIMNKLIIFCNFVHWMVGVKNGLNKLLMNFLFENIVQFMEKKLRMPLGD